MEKQTIKKRLTCLDIYNELQSYAILLSEQLGTGYFGTVMKAYNEANPYEELAVKVIPYHGDQNYKTTIDREIQIIHALGEHPNLVKVIPVKCRSENNFYIFMEYCGQGTLQQSIKQKLLSRNNFTQPQIFKTFFQVLNGYKVLWKKKILHQDLKPQNILIKYGIHKITDFGFSILFEGMKLGHKRQGTLEYMPLEKLTQLNYDASTKSDVYSLGVIFFKMITGRHPYILRSYQDDIEFIQQLKSAQLRPPSYIRARMSMPMQHLFELVIKMVIKDENQRVDFDEIYAYIDEEAEFLSFSDNQQNKESQLVESEEVHVPSYLEGNESRFVEYSTALAIPFSVMKSQEELYDELFRLKNLQIEEKRKFENIIKIENYLCSMRMMVYFFDRLARRLTVEWSRKEFVDILAEIKPPNLDLSEKVIIYLVFLSLKITKQTLEFRKPSSSYSQWTPQQWSSYRETRPNVIDLMENDQKYLEADKNELTMTRKQQSKILEVFAIIEEYKKPLIEFMELSVKPHLQELLKTRTSMIVMDDKKELTTLNYILTAIEIIENFQEQQNWEEIQAYFRQIETKQIDKLREKVHEGLKKHDLPRSYIEGDWNDEQQ